MSAPELNFSGLKGGSASRAGWRLRRLEMQNWGTFHWKVHRLVPDGGWSLVVGQNGSGKSTAIDALRTLLVPPRLLRQSYNDASSEGRSGDRTRYSYVRGAWKSQTTEAAAQGKPEYLRGEGEHSTLLAVFSNETKQATVTIAQILWLNGGKVDEVFLVALGDRSIREHLSTLGTGTATEWKRELKRRLWEVKDSFSAYAGRFTGLLGLPGDGALEVFNQAIGVKDVTDINDFIRRHMLEPADALDFIRDTLQSHYKELNDCWDSIKRAEDQVRALTAIAAAHERKSTAEKRLEEIQQLQQASPLYYSHRQLGLLREQVKELEVELSRLEGQRVTTETEQSTAHTRSESLQRAIAGSATGQELKRIEQELDFARRQLAEVERLCKIWREHLVTLGLSAPTHEGEFDPLRSSLITAKETQNAALIAADESLLSAREKLNAARVEESQLTSELQIARDRRVAIPAEFLRLRDALCDDTSVPTAALPFAGELMEVKSFHREWTGAIERVLHGFAVSLLVPQTHYDVTARWINSRHLGLRLGFFQVPERNLHLGDVALRADRVAARLDYRMDHPLHRWTAQEIARRFQHVCCEDVAQLARCDAGVTREGLVKESGTRHIKDDRHRVDDPRYWVLGWSAERKIKALLVAWQECQARKEEADKVLLSAATQKSTIERGLKAIDGLLGVGRFAEIDLPGAQEVIVSLEANRFRLLDADNEIKELERQLREAAQVVKDTGQQLVSIATQKGGLDERKSTNTKTQSEIETTLIPFPDFAPTTVAEPLAALENESPLTLANVARISADVAKRLQGQASHQTSVMNAADREMLPLMTGFLHSYAEYRGELLDRVDYSGEYAALRVRLEKDELPKHKSRFQKLMDESLVGGMAQFSSRLKQHEDDIRNRIDLVNGALRRIPFTNDSYVQIKPSATASREIGEFRSRLRACFEGGLRPADDQREVILAHIRSLMDDFRAKDEWTRRVTDARNWLEFGVRELALTDDRELNFLTGSGGRSTGQKAKLAFTILASAITAQYGLAESPDDPGAFRLVVIDEVFGHTDEEYSRQALDLFQSLGLQLIVVNPFDAKARIVEDYADTFHLTANPERNSSRISRATRTEYEAAWSDSTTNDDAGTNS